MPTSMSGNMNIYGNVTFSNGTGSPPTSPTIFNRMYVGGSTLETYDLDTYAAQTNPTPAVADQASLAVSQDLGLLAQIAYNSPLLQIYDISLATPTAITGPPTSPVDPLCVTFNPDSSYMVVGESLNNGFIKVYDTSDWSIVNAVPSPPANFSVNDIKFSPDGETLVVLCGANVFLFDTTTVPFVQLTSPATQPPNIPNQGSFKPDGTEFAIAINDNTTPCIVYDTSDWSVTANPNSGQRGFYTSYSPDGSFLYVNDAFQSVEVLVYETTGYTLLTNPGDYPSAVGEVAWSEDSTRMYISHDSGVAVYDTTTNPFTEVSGPVGVSSGMYKIAVSYAT